MEGMGLERKSGNVYAVLFPIINSPVVLCGRESGLADPCAD